MNGLLRSDKKPLETAKSELAKIPFGKEAIRLRAIIALNDNTAKTVAKVFSCSAGTLRNWVQRFASEGIGGLKDKKKKPRTPKLNGEQTKEILKLLDSCSKRWTLPTLQKEIKGRFGIDISLNGIWKMLKRERYSHVSPRPIHHKKKKEDEEAFKKNFRN